MWVLKVFFEPVRYALLSPDILKAIFMFGLLSLFGEIGTHNSTYSPGLMADAVLVSK